MSNSGLVKTAVETLKKQASEIDDLRSKLSTYEKRDEAVKLAHELVDKNLLGNDNIEDVVDEWVEQNKDLDTIREAAKIASYKPDGSIWAGLESPRDGSGSNPDDALLNWITS